MHKLIAPVLAVAAAGSGAVAMAGCGASDAKQAVGLDPAKAAAATASKGSARIALDTRIEGAGLPVPIEVKGKGVTSLTKPVGTLTLDLGPLLSLAGASGTPGALDLRFTGGTIFVKPPKLDQLKVPGGKSWVAVKLPALAKALGLPTRGLGKLFTLDPAAQLRALKAAKALKPVGKEVVGGAKTTHYRGTYRIADLLTTLSPADRADVQVALKKLQALGGGESLDQAIPADLWVDADGVTRKLQSTTKLPARGGQTGGTISQTYVLSDFGTPLDVTPPAAGDTYDATRTLSSVLGSVAAAGGTGTTTP